MKKAIAGAALSLAMAAGVAHAPDVPLTKIAQAVHYVPPVLLSYQQKWVADESEVKVAEKSRRIGLTWGEAAASALIASTTNGQDTWYIGYNKDMAEEFIKDCAMWAQAYNLAAAEIEEVEEVFTNGDESKSILTYVIRFASGHRITALSSRPNNLRGKQGRVIIDEAAFHEQLDELLKAAFALLIWGGSVQIISTHNGVDNPFNTLVEDIRAGKLPYSLHRITFDDALEAGLYERICLTTGQTWTPEAQTDWVQKIRAIYGDNAAEELDVIPKNGGGQYLSRALVESRMSAYTPIIRWQQKDEFNLLPESRRRQDCKDWIDRYLAPLLQGLWKYTKVYVGGDVARNNDQTVFVPLLQTQGLQLKCPFMIELRNIPFDQQEQILFYLLDHAPVLMGLALDARGIGAPLAERSMQRYGASRVQEVKATVDWYRQHVPPFKAALEDGTVDELPKDDDVLADFRLVEVIKGVPCIPEKRTKDGNGNKRHGDAFIATHLAFYASRELNKGPVRVKSRHKRQAKAILKGKLIW